jgi:type II secretory pathway component PulM
MRLADLRARLQEPVAPKPLASRALALGLLVLLLLVLKLAIVDPVLDAQRSSNEALAEAFAQLARLQRIAATKPALEKMAAKLAGEIGSSDAFLRADTEALAGAALQQRLRALTEAQGIAPGEIQWGAEQAGKGLGRISVRVQMSTTLSHLYRLMQSIETGTSPLLFLDNVDIQSTGGQQPDPQKEMPLSVSFECYGYWLPASGLPAKAAP